MGSEDNSSRGIRDHHGQFKSLTMSKHSASNVIRRVCRPFRLPRRFHDSLRHFASRSTHFLRTWQSSIYFWACVTGLVLLVNLTLTIWASASFPSDDGNLTLLDGSCSTVSNWDTWLHLATNFFSIILLSGSSYTMQCLGSPTRGELDTAHAKGSWLDVGIPSVRNLIKINRKRAVVWMFLASSSVPLALV